MLQLLNIACLPGGSPALFHVQQVLPTGFGLTLKLVICHELQVTAVLWQHLQRGAVDPQPSKLSRSCYVQGGLPCTASSAGTCTHLGPRPLASPGWPSQSWAHVAMRVWHEPAGVAHVLQGLQPHLQTLVDEGLADGPMVLLFPGSGSPFQYRQVPFIPTVQAMHAWPCMQHGTTCRSTHKMWQLRYSQQVAILIAHCAVDVGQGHAERMQAPVPVCHLSLVSAHATGTAGRLAVGLQGNQARRTSRR